MTAHELAYLLLKGPDVLVTVRGYEGGVDVIEEVLEPTPLHVDGQLGVYFGKSAYCHPRYCDSWINQDEHKTPDVVGIHLQAKR